MTRQKYWIGRRPSRGKKWSNTSNGTILKDADLLPKVVHLYNRYVDLGNEIELDTKRSLAEKPKSINGLKAVNKPGENCFTLHYGSPSREDDWILEVYFNRRFEVWHTGSSFCRNNLKSIDDIKLVCLHWSKSGKKAFYDWLELEDYPECQRQYGSPYL